MSNNDKINETNIQLTVIYLDPLEPKIRPNIPAKIELINGKKRNIKYIFYQKFKKSRI